MADHEEIHGRCLCGAVTVSARKAGDTLRACHCGMCRAWTSSLFMSVPTEPGSVIVKGPVKVFRSSDWAQRAFCDVCGSALWYETVHDNHRNLAAGLFENAAGTTLAMEFYDDLRPSGYAMAGDHTRLTEAETIALFTGETS